MAKETSCSGRTVTRVVVEKSEKSGAAFTSPAKRYKIERAILCGKCCVSTRR